MDSRLIRRKVRAAQIVDVVVDESRDHGFPVEIRFLGAVVCERAYRCGIADCHDAVTANRDGARDRKILVDRENLAIVENTVGRLSEAQCRKR